MNTAAIAIAFVFVVVAVVVYSSYNSRSGYTFDNADYQYGNPNLSRESSYYQCLAKECNNDTHDYNCLENTHSETYTYRERHTLRRRNTH